MRRRRSEKTKQKQGLNHGVKYRRKQKLQTPNKSQESTSIPINPEIKKEVQDLKKDENGATRFFGCYLLTSLSPRFKGHSYIGFTVNPKRRIRQHNGEITSGAFRTKKKRPWEMVLCIHGFPTNVDALQFEWAWQHPRESIAVREAAASFKTLGGLANKIKLALTMLTLHSWQSMNLTVSFFSTKYMKHAAGCPNLPPQMKLHFCSMDELPCYWNNDYPYGCDNEDDFDSNVSEVSDDRLKSSTDDSLDMNLSSAHVESGTIQKSSDDIWDGDRIATGDSLESESSSMMGTMERHIQSSLQFPVDVSGSTLSSLDELLRPREEFWIEKKMQPIDGVNASEDGTFPVIDGVNASEEGTFPVFEEKQSSCHILADVPASRGNDSNDFLRFGKEFGVEELKGSSPVMEDHLQPCQLAGPSDGQESSMAGFVSSMEDVVKKDEVTCIVIDDMTDENCQPTKAQSPFRFSNTVRQYSSKGIEVIELSTPSPDFRINRGSKKKRANSGFTDIIDLTRSPSFVQL